MREHINCREKGDTEMKNYYWCPIKIKRHKNIALGYRIKAVEHFFFNYKPL